MEEKRDRFSLKKARANMEWICPKSKGSETSAVDTSTADDKVHLFFSILKDVMEDAGVRQVVECMKI